ncbi:MAG: LacI family DNA-binding transcriptional regulator, partial [Clostridiales bacterium]|nr:LacI family DNA-binding transcriptional regulator [Candidatus Blautia equi]
MITLKEIAEICNVSVATVSNVLNGKAKTSAETREQILKVVKQTGYQPNYMAKGLRMQRTRTIALIVDDIAQFTSPPIVESIMEYCEKKNYRVTMRNLRLYSRWADSWQNQAAAFKAIVEPVIKDVLAAHVDGVIYIGGHCRNITCFDKTFPVPAVMCYGFSTIPEVPSVVIDDMPSAMEIVNYLIGRGHKKIGFIGGRSDNFHTQQRLRGYQKALFEHGILYDPDLVYYGDWKRETGFEGAAILMKKDVSAIFCCADKMAGGVYDYLE